MLSLHRKNQDTVHATSTLPALIYICGDVENASSLLLQCPRNIIVLIIGTQRLDLIYLLPNKYI